MGTWVEGGCSSTPVDVPAAFAFDIISNYQRWPEWSPWLERVDTFEPDNRGATSQWHLKFQMVDVNWGSRVVEHLPGAVLRWESTSGVRNSGSLEATDGANPCSCTITISIRYEIPSLIEKILSTKFVSNLVSRRLAADLSRFRVLAEQEYADGSSVTQRDRSGLPFMCQARSFTAGAVDDVQSAHDGEFDGRAGPSVAAWWRGATLGPFTKPICGRSIVARMSSRAPEWLCGDDTAMAHDKASALRRRLATPGARERFLTGLGMMDPEDFAESKLVLVLHIQRVARDEVAAARRDDSHAVRSGWISLANALMTGRFEVQGGDLLLADAITDQLPSAEAHRLSILCANTLPQSAVAAALRALKFVELGP